MPDAWHDPDGRPSRGNDSHSNKDLPSLSKGVATTLAQTKIQSSVAPQRATRPAPGYPQTAQALNRRTKMRNPYNRLVFEHFGQGTQLSHHNYTPDRLESVLLEFVENFGGKRSSLFSAFAEIKAAHNIGDTTLLAQAVGMLFTKETVMARESKLETAAAEADWGLSAIQARVEGHGRYLLFELAHFFVSAGETFGINDRRFGTEKISEEASFAEAVLYLWDATVNNEMWVDRHIVPDGPESDRILAGRDALQSIGLHPAGLDNAYGLRRIVEGFSDWIELETYLVVSICKAIRSEIQPRSNRLVNAIIDSASEYIEEQRAG